MKFYFLTDESEKSLAPFFSKRVLEAVMAGVVFVGVALIIFWSRRPLSEIIAAGDTPTIFFIIFAATLIVYSYINLCCGGGDLVRQGYLMIHHDTDKPTHEKEIAFYRYGMIEFFFAHAITAAALFAHVVPGGLQFSGFHDYICKGCFGLVHHVLVLSNVRFFNLLNLGKIKYPRLLFRPGPDDFLCSGNHLFCPGYQSVATSIPVESESGQQRLCLCNLYNGCFSCHTDPDPGK